MCENSQKNGSSGHLQEAAIEEITQIMGIEKDMLALLPKLISPTEAMNPWVEQLPAIFQQLDLKSGQVVLDIPCGTGRVSVPLAKKYQTEILGFDILPAYIESAQAFARLQAVEHLCTFSIADIRTVVEQPAICDLLLWIAPPHIWPNPRETVGNLRGCVRSGGHILIADAYLVDQPAQAVYPEYDVLEDSTAGYSTWGDTLIQMWDYKDTLWDDDYYRTRQLAFTALKRSTDQKERQLLQRYLDMLAEDEKDDKAYLGLAVWILKIDHAQE